MVRDDLEHGFERRARRVEANALVRYREETEPERIGGVFVGSRVVLRNEGAADPRRLLIFGDSYSYEAAPRLTTMLAETFGEVHAIWSADIDWAYVRAVKPDIVLFEIAERFLRRVPTDRFRVDAFAARRVRLASRPARAAAALVAAAGAPPGDGPSRAVSGAPTARSHATLRSISSSSQITPETPTNSALVACAAGLSRCAARSGAKVARNERITWRTPASLMVR